LILEVYNEFVGEAYFDIFGVIGVVFHGVVGSFPILRVHDSSNHTMYRKTSNHTMKHHV
jgi:hypothetical protein